MRKLDKEEFYKRLYSLKEKAFSFIYEAESVLNRIVLLALLLLFLIWINLGNIVDLLVSESRIKQNISGKLTEITGKKADISGDVIFRSEPEPIAVISKAVIANDSKLTKNNFFEAETIKIRPKILSALMGNSDFNDIYFENVKINVDSGIENKSGIFEVLTKTFSRFGKFRDKKIIFKNLQVNFYKKNPLNDKKPVVRSYNFPELELNPNPSNSKVAFEFKGSLSSQKLQENYFFDIGLGEGFGVPSSYKGRLYSTSTDLNFAGQIDTKDKNVKFSGNLEGKASGVSKKIFSLVGFSEAFLDSLKDTDDNKLSANFTFDGKRFELKDLTGEGDIVSFIVNGSTEFNEANNSMVEVNVSKVDYSKMFKTQLEMLHEKKAQKVERDFKKRMEDYFLFAVGDDTNFTFAMDIPKIDFFHGKTGSLKVRTVLKDNQIKINDFEAKLPGASVLNIVGLAEINKDEKKLKGAARIVFAGKRMDELVLAMDTDGIEEKEERFGPFYIDAKGFLYGQNIHFRDIVARINNDKFAGQMLIDYSKELKASAAFNFTSLNIDKYLMLDKNVDAGIVKEENALSSKFDFLRVVDSIFDSLDISLVANNLVKAGYNYHDVSLFTQISPGITEIRNLYFVSDMLGEVSGRAHLDLTDFQPRIDVDLEIDKYDLDLLIYGEEIHQNDEYRFDGKWSNEKISFERLGNFVGKLNLKIDKLKIFHFMLEKFALSSHAEESKFVVDDSRANIFGNKVDFKGYLTTEYPSFNLSFIASDLDSEAFMSDTFNMDQLTSTFNISGVLASTGYSIEQMIQNLKGNFSVATKGLVISGFDLTAVGKALPIVKRREYIKLISDELLNRGETQFAFFTGGFNIDAGQITFNNLTFAGPNVDKMVASGVIDLPKWEVNIDSDMMVKTTDGMPFSLRGKTTGTIPNVRTIWDDKGMIKFWEDKFFGSSR